MIFVVKRLHQTDAPLLRASGVRQEVLEVFRTDVSHLHERVLDVCHTSAPLALMRLMKSRHQKVTFPCVDPRMTCGPGLVPHQMVILMDPLEDPDDILRANRSREKTYMFDVAFDYLASQVSPERRTDETGTGP